MKNKKNFTILGIGVINLIASFFAVSVPPLLRMVFQSCEKSL